MSPIERFCPIKSFRALLPFLRTFGWSLAITAIGLIGSGLLGGGTVLAIVAILAVLEISLSFDNAVVNATVLKRMNPFWQKIFLTVGIAIAVFGMRLIFPLALVSATATMNPLHVVELALQGGGPETPGTYSYLLRQAHPAIAAFGGTFLLMIFLDFMFEERDLKWLAWLERPLARIGRLNQVSVVIALTALAVVAELLAADTARVLLSGVLGMAVYLLVKALGEIFESGSDEETADVMGGSDGAPDASDTVSRGSVVKVSGKAAFFLFLYLEMLDASFSFDGVIGAFAISQNIFVIAVGLGIGAMYIRSLTVYLVRQGTLDEYVYLEHGAHWAIGALAIILLLSVRYEIPEVITGLIGVGFIGAALLSSIMRKRTRPSEAEPDADKADRASAAR